MNDNLLGIIITSIVVIIFCILTTNMSNKAEECDAKLGRVCDIYEVQNYVRSK